MKLIKRIVSAAAALCLASTAFAYSQQVKDFGFSFSAGAAGYTSDDLSLEYSVLNDGTVEITGYISSASADIEIPSVIDGREVASIGQHAFSNCSSLTSITIPDSVTSIGNYAFVGCYSLTSITISANNKNYSDIDGVLFNKEQSELIQYPAEKSNTSYIIPDSVTSVGDFAFDNCFSLTSITIPDSVISIGDYAFNLCSSLTSVAIPDSVTSIGDIAFLNCYSLTYITISDSNKNYSDIDGVLFNKGQSELICYPAGRTDDSYIIPDSVTSIGRAAIHDCSSLASITMPDIVTSIGNNAFEGCSSLTSITIPDGVISIGDYAFNLCSSLTSVTIPDSVTSIGCGAFAQCDGLTSIAILNPNCEIFVYVDEEPIYNYYDLDGKCVYDGVIYGYAGSTAQEYAEKYGRTFVEISSMQGDVNNNGSFNVSDLVMMQKWLLNDDAEIINWQNGDLNDDGVLDVFDLVLMRRLLVQQMYD